MLTHKYNVIKQKINFKGDTNKIKVTVKLYYYNFQLQGVKWIKQKYGDNLQVIRLGQKGYLDTIEKSIIKGKTVIFENIGETVDPVLDPLLGRNLIKKGK